MLLRLARPVGHCCWGNRSCTPWMVAAVGQTCTVDASDSATIKRGQGGKLIETRTIVSVEQGLDRWSGCKRVVLYLPACGGRRRGWPATG
eukprot:3679931-Pleurochrysis_carterae.AAC.1